MKVIASVLNVRSGPGITFEVITQVRRDDRVLVIETFGDWSRLASPCGWVSSRFLAPPLLTPPSGLAGLEQMFGKPTSPECSAGRIQLPSPLKIGWMNAQVTILACHAEMEGVFSQLFAEIYAKDLWRKIKTYDGIYSPRKIGRTGKWSTHAWGIAIDLNAATNRQGAPGDMDRDLVMTFESHGFVWGGDWAGAKKDAMHFQFVRGY